MRISARAWKSFAVLAGVTTALGLGAGAAGATVTGQEHYSGTDSFTNEHCGYPLDVQVAFHGQVLFRADQDGQAFFVKDTNFFRDVITNRTTGRWFVITGHLLTHDVKATHVAGNIYEFVTLTAGQPFTVYDSNGTLVERDRGAVFDDILFDTLGDGQPGGEPITEVSFVVHGPHPALDEGFCAIADRLTVA